MPKDIIITPANSFMEFRDTNSNVDAMIYLDNSRNLNIINPNGQLTFGTTAANVYIGDGTSVVDIIFEQNGSIRALTGKTLTLGQSDSSIAFAGNVTGGYRVTSGNVGIGTANPTSTLHVIGTANVSANLTVGAGAVGSPSITTAGDNNTGLYFPAADALAVTTGGSERSRYFSNGWFGHGTSTPQLGYHIVAPGIRLDSTDGNFEVDQAVSAWTNSTFHKIIWWAWNGTYDDHLYLASGGNAAVNTQSALIISENSGLLFGKGNTNNNTVLTTVNFFVTNSGVGYFRANVGIGTLSPTANLHVVGTANITNSLVVDSGNIAMGTATTYGELQIANNTLGTSVDNTRELLRLSTTTSNADHLEFFKLRTSAASDWQSAGWRIQQKVDSTWHGYIQFNGDNNEGLTFGAGGSTTSPRSVTERMRINNSGNVGIGTTNPATRLHVFGGFIQHTGDIRCHPTSNTAQTSAWMTFDGHDNGNAIYLGGGGLTVIGGGESAAAVRGNIAIDDERLVFASDASGTNPAFQFNANLQNGWANTVNVMTMLGNGNVGIGTTSPADKLDVYGSIVIRSAYNLSWGGTYGANIPTIVGVSGAGAYLAVYPSGSSNSERLRITDVGNIGIGTSSPGYVVTNRRVVAINGGSGAGEGALLAFMQGGTNKGYLYSAQNIMELWSESGGVTIGNNASAPIDFKTNNQTRMYILGTGNVGIGTTNPANKLDVYIGDISIRATEGVGTRDNRLLKIFRGSLGADQAGVIFGTGPSTENWFIGHPYSGGGVFNALVISENPQINDGTATLVKTPIMYFTPGAGTAAGNVGIGTTNPQGKLDVLGNKFIFRNSNTIDTIGNFDVINNVGSPVSVRLAFGTDNTGWQMRFAKNAGGTYTDYMTIQDNGNIGIGTTSAAAKLDIYPGGSDLGVGANGIRVQRPASYGQYGYLEYLISSDITVLGSLYTGGGASAFGQIYLRQHSSTTSRDSMVINGSGNVGINTTSPAERLHVVGRVIANAVSELSTSPAISSGTLTLDLAASAVFTVSLNANITTLTLNNIAASGRTSSFVLVLTADGTARTVTWPGSFKWPGGTAPTLTSTLNKIDIITAFTTNGGTNWYAFATGQNL